uniref:Uncharacterized protein n=1 Tax=Anguilla anguilla TaxID=7936 RepID=A0A0E9VGM8_ANGAN
MKSSRAWKSSDEEEADEEQQGLEQ